MWSRRGAQVAGTAWKAVPRETCVVLLMLGLMLLLAGCVPRTDRPAPPGAYFGETETMYDVVRQINANNLALPTLWARHEFEATIYDPETDRSHFVNGNGALLYRRPHEMLMRGAKTGFGHIFDIASTEDRFWMMLIPEVDTMWWGHYRNVGRPCAEEIPIRPDLILEVLGIGEIDMDFTREPAPTMRFNNDADAYMFVWNVRGPDRWIAQREVWYDRQTKRPMMVLLFDAHGRVVLRAYLSDHTRVESPDRPADEWPTVATDYRLFFPDTGTRMWISLEEVRLEYRGAPNDRVFMFPARPRVSQVIQIDEECD